MPRAAAKPAPAPPEPIPPPSAQDLTEDAQHRRVLALLVDLGAALAEEIAKTPDPEATPALRAEAFERVSRATRRTILVARHVAQQIAQRTAERAAEHRRAPSPAQRRTAARARLIREVEDTIQTKARPADADALRAELIDRLDAPELETDLLERPTADLIAEFLRDLGLAHPPGVRPIGRRTPADIARLNLLAALPPGQAAAIAATFPAPTPPPPEKPAPPPAPPLPKKSWRDKPPPDPDSGIRPDSLLASILKTTDR